MAFSKKPGTPGLQLIGWYEDATLTGQEPDRPEPFPKGDVPLAPEHRYTFTLSAPRAFLVPVDQRKPKDALDAIKRQFAYLTPADTDNKKAPHSYIRRRLRAVIKSGAVRAQPGKGPMGGSAEEKTKIEQAAVTYATRWLRARGFRVESREHIKNIDYDLHATRGEDVLRVEVKGRGSASDEVILTCSEYCTMKAKPKTWRLFVVSSALDGQSAA